MAQNDSSQSMEQRVAMLEKKVAELQSEVERLSPPKDWRSTIGMFAGDEVMERIREAGRKIREADRKRAKRQTSRPRQKVRK